MSKLLERIRSTDSLPSLPTVAVDVLRLTRKEDVAIDELAAVIQNDPGLTAKILKVVNSPLFGIPREISSLKQAINMLGLRTVKVMALSFSLVETVSRAKCDGFDFSAYWRRSLTTGVAARLIARVAAPRLAEEAFVAGLLSDVGIVAAWRVAPGPYIKVHQEWRESGGSLAHVEAEKLGCSHAAMSAELLQAWGLPTTVCSAVRSHHGEGLDQAKADDLLIGKLVACAAEIADLFMTDTPCSELFNLKTRVGQTSGLTDGQLDELMSALSKHVKQTASMLNVQIGDTVHYAQLQQEAAVQLAKLSMQAELDRVESVKRETAMRAEAERLNQEKHAILEVASTDGLTKVANRAAFDRRLDEEVQRAAAQGDAIALIMMDVDHFKKFNDMYGHQAGDEVLRCVGQCLKEVVNTAGFVARYGGEEFAVMMIGQAAGEVRNLAEQIRRAIEQRTIEFGGQQLKVTASLGTAAMQPSSATGIANRIVQEADAKLYEAKRAGRNRVS